MKISEIASIEDEITNGGAAGVTHVHVTTNSPLNKSSSIAPCHVIKSISRILIKKLSFQMFYNSTPAYINNPNNQFSVPGSVGQSLIKCFEARPLGSVGPLKVVQNDRYRNPDRFSEI